MGAESSGIGFYSCLKVPRNGHMAIQMPPRVVTSSPALACQLRNHPEIPGAATACDRRRATDLRLPLSTGWRNRIYRSPARCLRSSFAGVDEAVCQTFTGSASWELPVIGHGPPSHPL